MGNQVCDEVNNNEECFQDGADCLFINCAFHSLVMDGICDDDTNFEWCLFDGGDCCGESSIKIFCYDCRCNAGKYRP